MEKLRMKRVWTLLVFLTFVSVSFGGTVPLKNGTSVATALPEADRVDAKGLPAAGVGKLAQERVEIFHTVMVCIIIGGSTCLICVAVIQALCAPKTKEYKLRPEDRNAVKKQPWIKGSEGEILVKCPVEV